MMGSLTELVAKYFSAVVWICAMVPSILDASILMAMSMVGCRRLSIRKGSIVPTDETKERSEDADDDGSLGYTLEEVSLDGSES